MTNKLSYQTQKQLQTELIQANQQLQQTQKVIAQKDHIIDSLKIDLEHMVDQMVKIQTVKSQADMISKSSQWIRRPVPGLNVTVNA